MPTVTGSGAAIEGDSVSVNGQVVKLWGIDSPEVSQTCWNSRGVEYDCFTPAKAALSSLIGTRQVICYIRGQDRHGQKTGTCAVDGQDLAALMVREGWAVAYTELSPQYAELEAMAQARQRGVWAGRLLMPWVWRGQNVSGP